MDNTDHSTGDSGSHIFILSQVIRLRPLTYTLKLLIPAFSLIFGWKVITDLNIFQTQIITVSQPVGINAISSTGIIGIARLANGDLHCWGFLPSSDDHKLLQEVTNITGFSAKEQQPPVAPWNKILTIKIFILQVQYSNPR